MSTTLALCAMLTTEAGDIAQLRQAGRSEQEVLEIYQDKPVQGVITMIYALPQGASHRSVKAQLMLNCDNDQVLERYQYPGAPMPHGKVHDVPCESDIINR